MKFTTSPDNIRIAYEVNGSGAGIMLLHGGGGSHLDWHTGGYVEQLRGKYTVISVDLRGHGESDKPTDPSYYSTEKMGRDILAVADACDIDRFLLCGYSFGGNVGRYLAARSDRISKMVMIGNRLGTGISGEFRQFVFDFRARWSSIVKSPPGGTFDPKSLSARDQEDIEQLSFPGELLPAVLAWSSAMLDWSIVTPANLRCPTLWLIGSENQGALNNYKDFENELKSSNVQVHIFEGLTHEQEFKNIKQILPVIFAFVES